jgi:hypothetical protein
VSADKTYLLNEICSYLKLSLKDGGLDDRSDMNNITEGNTRNFSYYYEGAQPPES